MAEPFSLSALLIPLLSALGGGAAASMSFPQGTQFGSFSGTGADPAGTLSQGLELIRRMGGSFAQHASRPAQLPTAFAQQPASFSGGGLPMPIGVTGMDPALQNPSLLGLPGLDFSRLGGDILNAPPTPDAPTPIGPDPFEPPPPGTDPGKPTPVPPGPGPRRPSLTSPSGFQEDPLGLDPMQNNVLRRRLGTSSSLSAEAPNPDPAGFAEAMSAFELLGVSPRKGKSFLS